MRVRALAVLLVTGLVAGCAPGADDTQTQDPEQGVADEGDEERRDAERAEDEQGEAEAAGDLLVVATLAPLADVVERVLGDRGTVETLIPAGMDSHSYEPRPSDVAPLSEADAFFGVGLGLSPAAVDLAKANLPGEARLVLLGEEALTGTALIDDHWHAHDDDDHDHSHDDDDHDHSHSEDDAHDDGDSHDHGDQGDVNPHVWTSVANVQRFVDGIAGALADIDPDHQDDYRERAEAYLAELEALDEAIGQAVASIPERARRLVVYHDAWTYFGAAYGVDVIAAVQPSNFSEPSAGDVRAIIDQIRDENVPAVFGSEEFPNDVVVAIAEETGAVYIGNLADDMLPGEPGEADHSYVGMMRLNAVRIVEGLGGDPSALHLLGG